MNSIEFFALSQAQLRLIPSEIQDPGTTAYTISKRYVFSDIATDDLVQRIANAISSAMRIRLHQNDDGDVVQYVGEAPIVDIIDMSEASESDIESMRNERLYAVFPEIFDVPLVKLTLMVLPEGRHELLAVFHHAIADGTTTIHFGERIESASAYDNGEYRSYVEAEYDYLNSEACKADVEWWANALELYSDSIVNDLPLAEGEGCLADTIDIRFTADETAAINNAIGKISGQRISPFVFTSAMLSVYLSRIYGNPQTVLSTAFNTREKDMRQCDGMFVNLLAIPYSYSPDKSLTDLLVDTKTTLKDGLSHGRCPFNVYANELTRRGRDVESIIRYNVVSNSGESKTIRAVEHYESHLPLTVRVNYNLSDKAGLQLITLEYQTAAFTNEQMENMAFQMKTMIMYAVNHPDLPCGEWKMPLSDAEMARLANFNRTECEYDNTQTIPSLFRKAAAMYPDNDCVVYDGRHYSYKEVDELSDNIAWMIHERGIGREQVVSVLIPRCEYMAIASLGIVKAGAAYQPLDPTYPEERLNFMMKDADARLLICDRSLRAKVNEYQGDILYIDEIQATVPRSFASGLPLSPLPSSLFILLYTSGSTGTPKGCQIEQRNIVAFCHWYQREYQLTSESRASAYASYGFDANMMDTWPALTIGASVHIISEDLRMNLVALNDYFEHNGITHCLMTTQIGRQFATEIDNHSLLHLNVGGEKLVPCNPPKKYMLHNAYGPTEGTIVATSFIVDRLYANVPIGRPVDNMKAYVIDKQKHLLPVGAAGELCISGPQISRGYLNRPEQTAKAYEPNPFSNEDGYERIYHTGDIVRWLPDGNIEFVGRKDAQVKIRGFRIELTEVEAVLREYPQIKDATVQAFDEPNGNGKFICAYIVSDEKIDIQSLNSFIEERKPPYMVPAVTMQIDKIPLNQNQKVNKRALPKPERQAETYVMPQTDMQQRLYDIAAEIIGNKDFGITNNLFYYGLTSITAIKLAVRINNVLGIAVQNRQLKENNTIEKLASLLEAQRGVETVDFETLADYPLTQSQTGIYVECSANEGTTIYNIPYLLQLSPEVDVCKLEKALRQAVENHKEIKRHLTVNAEGEVRQKPMPNADIEITRSKTDEATLLADTSLLVKPYKLLDSNLYRFEIIETGCHPYLYLDFHHIISDGTSMNILVEDINHIYNGESVEEEKIDAFECAQLEEYERTTEAYTKAKAYYDSLFGDVEDIAGFATDDLAVVPEEKIAWNTLNDDRQSTSAIRDYCRKNAVTENAFFNAVFGFVLAKYNNASEAVFATIYNGRNDSRKMRTMDMMVKTMPCRFRMSDGSAVIDIIRSQASQIEDLMANDLFSFAEANHNYGVTADTLLAYQGDSFGVKVLAGHPATAIPVSLNTAKADITLQIFINDGCLEYKAEYNPRKYSADTIENILSSISETAHQFAVCKNINDVAMLDKRHAAVLDEFNRTECDYDNTQTIPSLFRKAAAMYPDNDCVVYDGRHYSYKEVDTISDNIAWMIHERGIGREQVVSVLIPRCEYMAIASLGIVKAGAAYQPLDPTYPEERLNFMMQDADARLLICDRSLRPKVNEYQGDILYIDEITTTASSPSATVPRSFASGRLPLSPLPSSLFILLYTSGSTGTPKGCQIEHRNIVAFCHWYQRYYNLHPAHKVAAYASYGFDANMMDMYPAITCGASTHIIPEEIRLDIIALNEYFEREGITHSFMTTQVGRMFATSVDNHSLFHLSIGGEKLVPCEVDKPYKFYNVYGPTECTIFSTAYPMTSIKDNVPIGSPVDNMKAYVIDKQKHLLPIGAPGELCLSGPQISRGYLNRPEQTAKAYEPNPFSNEDGYERIYHTGDIVRWLPDGNIEFVGRKDAQVKIRGFRIELTEVEAVVREYPQIKDATVQAFDAPGGGKFICAYIVSDEKVDVQSLNAFIQERKPPYMVPAVTMQIDKIPLNQNQKVNKKALPTPELKQEETTSSFVAPKTDLQKTICDIYSEVLGLERVGITDNFFLIGGTSILAIKVAMKCMLKGLHVVYSEIFQYAMPAELAAYLEGKEVNDSASSSVEVATDSDKEESETTVDQPWRKALVYNNSEHVGLLDITPTHTYLLTGATGFLGVHILNYIIENTDATVYCLVRKGSFDSPEERLEGICFYYFNKSYADLVGKRIFCIDGEIDNKTLVDSLADLPFDTLINAAAIVKHFSNDDSLERVNVEGVRYLAEMCLRAGRRITHVSTLSVGGLNVDNAVDINRKFYESDLFFGQDTTYNVYVDTKSRGEEALLNLVPSGLKGKIVRVGNLMSRNDDGEFQINFNTNGFMRTLRGYTTLGCCPVSLADKEYEFSPIDAVAKAIVMLSDTNPEFTVFHIYNRHRVHLIDIIQMLNDMGMKIDMVEDNVFQQHLMKAFENGADDKIGGLVSYKSKASKHILRPIEWNSDFTTKVLYRLGFTWPITGHGYIHNAIDAVRSLGFFD